MSCWYTLDKPFIRLLSPILEGVASLAFCCFEISLEEYYCVWRIPLSQACLMSLS